MTDGQLIERFLTRGDQAAFESLVARHGPMVLGVCRQVLGDLHDAEDAFQATFLVLARSAGQIVKREVLGSWLYGVAYRIAVRARVDAAGRHARERPIAEVVAVGADDDRDRRELQAVLHEEVNRLPEKYRSPIVLCYLEGQTHEEAAEALCWPVGTVKGRLARARALLQTRLGHRGLAVPATFCVAALSQGTAAGVSPALVAVTVETAVRFSAGGDDPGALPAPLSAMVAAAPRLRSLARRVCTCLRRRLRATCHVPPLFTEPGFNLHTPAEIGIDSFQADRSPTKLSDLAAAGPLDPHQGRLLPRRPVRDPRRRRQPLQ
jgi:RNA polymerase sigma factor (sigma-70 family)